MWILILIVCFLLLSLIMVCRKSFEKTKKNIVDRIYYINLDRRPDRNAHMLKQMQNERINMKLVERFPAIDGQSLILTPEQEKMFAHADYIRDDNRKQIIGNQLSHYQILQDMLKKNYDNILILQDDVVFKKGFLKYLEKVMNNIPKDAEIVNLGTHKYGNRAVFVPVDMENNKENDMDCKTDINETICRIHNHTNPYSLAYIVTKKGASNLIEYFNKTGFLRATDWNYNDYLSSKNINYASKKVLCTGALMGSDIGYFQLNRLKFPIHLFL